MDTTLTLDVRPQIQMRRTAWNIAANAGGYGTVLAAWLLWPRMVPIPNGVDRLGFAMTLCGIVAAVAVKTKAHEPALVFAPLFLALAVQMDEIHVFMLPALLAIWCIGALAAREWSFIASAVSFIWLASTLF